MICGVEAVVGRPLHTSLDKKNRKIQRSIFRDFEADRS